ncbi:4'-phosphopantetheinyl transferase superfamily protein [Aureisphaera galaxeae]|uniref:4'-phosphopantetheinyl transferase family protein n=1 Tax=Aureisphaera galaxeae TaxID=1538023 RepID=UPI002350A4FA|nr:4'-phosphopantetheinyl transferase superfamily protein [Aureisphaera galaxeae]MDC8004709.1 4'-phosphopantetheinyl transferase superfamily protein [Aureisphaera galaxeae]
MTNLYYTYISKEVHDDLLKRFLPSFPREYQERVLKYRRWQDAQLSILGRLLLRYGLQQHNYAGEGEIFYNEYNKPFLKDKDIKFNISHSGDIVVCAITDVCDIGVDIEIMGEINVQDFQKQMTPSEWTKICSASDKQTAFYDYWTQKEATLKANGMGLSIPLNSFEIIDNASVVDNETFFLEELDVQENYKCHIAFKGQNTDICIAHLKEAFA